MWHHRSYYLVEVNLGKIRLKPRELQRIEYVWIGFLSWPLLLLPSVLS